MSNRKRRRAQNNKTLGDVLMENLLKFVEYKLKIKGKKPNEEKTMLRINFLLH